MSNLLVNIRFGAYHFQISRDRPWISWAFNECHAKKNRRWDFRWFVIYKFPGINTDPGC